MPIISINQLADFSSASAKRRKSIIKQQITVNKQKVSWYQRAKGAMRRYLVNPTDPSPLHEALAFFHSAVPATEHARRDKKVSVEALQTMLKVRVPSLLSAHTFEIIRPNTKSLSFRDVDVIVSPDLIIRTKYQGKTYYGAIKLHICKTRPFDKAQCEYVAALLYEYLSRQIIGPGEEVKPELCLCLDVFAQRFVTARSNNSVAMKEIKEFCLEVSKIWGSLI